MRPRGRAEDEHPVGEARGLVDVVGHVDYRGGAFLAARMDRSSASWSSALVTVGREGDTAVAPRAELGGAEPRDANIRDYVERIVVNAVLLGLSLVFTRAGLLDLLR